MKPADDSPNDPLEAMLKRVQGPGADVEFRAAVLSRTVGVIRFRRRFKKGLLALSLAGCYLAGMASAHVWRVFPAAESRLPMDQSATAPPSTSTRPPSFEREPRPIASEATRMEALHRQAESLLWNEGDVRGAIQEYARILDLASADERAIALEQENWLLMALKYSRVKELAHGRDEPK